MLYNKILKINSNIKCLNFHTLRKSKINKFTDNPQTYFIAELFLIIKTIFYFQAYFNITKQFLLLILYLTNFYIVNKNKKLRHFCLSIKKKRNFKPKYFDFKQILKVVLEKFSNFGRKKVKNCRFWKKIVAFCKNISLPLLTLLFPYFKMPKKENLFENKLFKFEKYVLFHLFPSSSLETFLFFKKLSPFFFTYIIFTLSL